MSYTNFENFHYIMQLNKKQTNILNFFVHIFVVAKNILYDESYKTSCWNPCYTRTLYKHCGITIQSYRGLT